MRLHHLASLALALGASANPVPQDDKDVCSLNPFDKGTWWDSGARTYLDEWFKNHDGDEHDWLYKMDVETTNGAGNSVLDCKPLGAQGTCGSPETQCQFFTPNSYFYIRQMAANFNQYLTWTHEVLQDFAISETLGLDEMVSDLNVYVSNETWLDNLLRTFAAVFSISDKFIKQGKGYGLLADGMGVIGGIINIASANNSPGYPTAQELKEKVENVLKAFFDGTKENLQNIQNRMFGGDQVDAETDILDAFTAQLGDMGFPLEGESKISQVFSSGAFLESMSRSDISDGIDAGFAHMKHALIGALFKASNIFVWGVRMWEPEKFCQNYGDRQIGDWCYNLYYLDGMEQKQVDPDVLNKLEFKYNLDPRALYTNVEKCNNAHNAEGYEGPHKLGMESDENGYTACFFQIDLIKAWEVDCFEGNEDGYPDYYAEWYRTGRRDDDLICRKGAS
ncbi:hypothetical protein BJY04DRAFT_222975 [Aspergillus karnatakaensis]|uniref:uncharacterized protein n=1 Tax=Aspergillus karnatakaensis TaxID=1810916 RepID=UPI003CCD89FE